jgi:hypothetical protein
MSALSSAILEWSAAGQSPFDDEHLPSKHTKGHLSTMEIYERLTALVDCGDIEYEAEEAITQADVSAALHTLYDRQQLAARAAGHTQSAAHWHRAALAHRPATSA